MKKNKFLKIVLIILFAFLGLIFTRNFNKDLIMHEKEVNLKTKETLQKQQSELNQEVSELQRKFKTDLNLFKIKEEQRFIDAQERLENEYLLKQLNLQKVAAETKNINNATLNIKRTKTRKRLRTVLVKEKKKISEETNIRIKKLKEKLQ